MTKELTQQKLGNISLLVRYTSYTTTSFRCVISVKILTQYKSFILIRLVFIFILHIVPMVMKVEAQEEKCVKLSGSTHIQYIIYTALIAEGETDL